MTAWFYPRMFAEQPELLRVLNLAKWAIGEQSRALAASVVAYQWAGMDADHVAAWSKGGAGTSATA